MACATTGQPSPSRVVRQRGFAATLPYQASKSFGYDTGAGAFENTATNSVSSSEPAYSILE